MKFLSSSTIAYLAIVPSAVIAASAKDNDNSETKGTWKVNEAGGFSFSGSGPIQSLTDFLKTLQSSSSTNNVSEERQEPEDFGPYRRVVAPSAERSIGNPSSSYDPLRNFSYIPPPSRDVFYSSNWDDSSEDSDPPNILPFRPRYFRKSSDDDSDDNSDDEISSNEEIHGFVPKNPELRIGNEFSSSNNNERNETVYFKPIERSSSERNESDEVSFRITNNNPFSMKVLDDGLEYVPRSRNDDHSEEMPLPPPDFGRRTGFSMQPKPKALHFVPGKGFVEMEEEPSQNAESNEGPLMHPFRIEEEIPMHPSFISVERNESRFGMEQPEPRFREENAEESRMPLFRPEFHPDPRPFRVEEQLEESRIPLFRWEIPLHPDPHPFSFEEQAEESLIPLFGRDPHPFSFEEQAEESRMPLFGQEIPLHPDPYYEELKEESRMLRSRNEIPVHPEPLFGEEPTMPEEPRFREEQPIHPEPRFREEQPIHPEPRFREEQPIHPEPHFREEQPIHPEPRVTEETRMPRFEKREAMGEEMSRNGEERNMNEEMHMPRYREERPIHEESRYREEPHREEEASNTKNLREQGNQREYRNARENAEKNVEEREDGQQSEHQEEEADDVRKVIAEIKSIQKDLNKLSEDYKKASTEKDKKEITKKLEDHKNRLHELSESPAGQNKSNKKLVLECQNVIDSMKKVPEESGSSSKPQEVSKEGMGMMPKVAIGGSLLVVGAVVAFFGYKKMYSSSPQGVVSNA